MKTTTSKGSRVELTATAGKVLAVVTKTDGTRLEGEALGHNGRDGVVIQLQGGKALALMGESEWASLKDEARGARNETPAEAAWAEVGRAYDRIEAAEESAYYDPAKICKARNAAEQAEKKFADAYPAEYAEKQAAKEALRQEEVDRREREFRSSFIGRGLD